jgi:hypothetical protein
VVTKGQKGGLGTVGYEPHGSTATAIAAVRATLIDVGFASKGDGSRPSVATFGVELGFIDEGSHELSLGALGRNSGLASFVVEAAGDL